MATLENVVNRAAEVAGVYGRLRTMPERVDALSLATLSAKAAGQQLELFCYWCYQESAPGILCNILPNGQIPTGSWAPWGSSGKSGMTRTDRDIVRAWLRTLQARRHFPPWRYDPSSRRWYVDLLRYESLTGALGWLAKYPIHPQDWLNLRLATRRSARK